MLCTVLCWFWASLIKCCIILCWQPKALHWMTYSWPNKPKPFGLSVVNVHNTSYVCIHPAWMYIMLCTLLSSCPLNKHDSVPCSNGRPETHPDTALTSWGPCVFCSTADALRPWSSGVDLRKLHGPFFKVVGWLVWIGLSQVSCAQSVQLPSWTQGAERQEGRITHTSKPENPNTITNQLRQKQKTTTEKNYALQPTGGAIPVYYILVFWGHNGLRERQGE